VIMMYLDITGDNLQACYQQLYTAGMKGFLRYAPNYYQYSHQKFWIVDNTTVHLSTGAYMYVCLYNCVCTCMGPEISKAQY